MTIPNQSLEIYVWADGIREWVLWQNNSQFVPQQLSLVLPNLKKDNPSRKFRLYIDGNLVDETL